MDILGVFRIRSMKRTMTTMDTVREKNPALIPPPEFPGLSDQEAASARLQFGENVVFRKKRLRPIIAFLQKFNSPLLLLLIGAAAVSFFSGSTVSASIIFVMVCMSAVLDFVNSHKSEKVADALISRVAATATVWRNSRQVELPFAALVPGDVVELSAGDVIPADGAVISADDFFVNQSVLTGESFPVEKRARGIADVQQDLVSESPLHPESEGHVFMGTSVVTGYALAVVLRTGARAEFGKISERLSTQEQETSFERGMKDFSWFIARLSFGMVLFVILVNVYQARPLIDAFLFAIAIAVGLTPELLPVIMSVALSRGSLIMARKNVVVKNLSSVQNFGGMNILCTDKTGTLTEDRITLVKCVDITGEVSNDVLRYAYASSQFHTAKRSPLDEAIHAHASVDISCYTKIDEIPFDFERRRDSIVVEEDDHRLMITKGAPEGIFAISNYVASGGGISPFDSDAQKKAQEEYQRLSSEGFRVLALATRELPKTNRTIYQKNEEAGMVFVGFAAFLDPPKPTASVALEELRRLSVEVKVITGDSEVLTERICRDIGLTITGTMTGPELTQLTDEQLMLRAPAVNVFARVTPEQKERIVTALRRVGNVVGYMGDGINDAPVLRAADVGISVNNAVDVAKETADIILLTKSLSVLTDGVIEGRKTFLNTLKYVKMGFSSNFGNMFSMMGASAFLPYLPMTAPQILLNNFLYDISQTTLPGDRTDHEATTKPLRWDMRSLARYIIVFGFLSSIFDFLTFYVLYKVFALGESGFQTGWFIESIATQILIIFIIRTKRTPFWKSMPALGITLSSIGVVALAWAIPLTSLGTLLGFTTLPLQVLLSIVGIVALYLSLGDVTKRFFYLWVPKAP